MGGLLTKRPTQAPHLAGTTEVEPEAPNIDSHEDFPNLATPARPTKAPPRVEKRSVAPSRSTLGHTDSGKVPVKTQKDRKVQAKAKRKAR
eukprot:1027089-Alexandrium_andersonii.AAC.1